MSEMSGQNKEMTSHWSSCSIVNKYKQDKYNVLFLDIDKY